MTEKKSARLDAATSRRATMERRRESVFSKNNFTTWGGTISSLLQRGQDNAVPLQHLQVLTGMDGRSIRLMIEKERRAGVPILADNLSGYFLPRDDEERVAFVRSMRHRANEILRTAQAVENGVY